MAEPAAVTIRPLAPADRSGWAPLWEAYNRFYERTIPAEVTEVTWTRLMAPDEDPRGFVAVDGEGRLVGFTHFLFHRSTSQIGPVCYLQDLFVSPGVRNSGAGRALIEAVYGAADAAGAEQVYWLTQTFNETARRLYDRVASVTPFIKYRR